MKCKLAHIYIFLLTKNAVNTLIVLCYHKDPYKERTPNQVRIYEKRNFPRIRTITSPETSAVASARR